LKIQLSIQLWKTSVAEKTAQNKYSYPEKTAHQTFEPRKLMQLWHINREIFYYYWKK